MFHSFTRLPFELRAQIWELSVEPRIVKVQTDAKQNLPQNSVKYFSSPTRVPAVLQTCQEARNLSLYERAFTGGSTPRYVWVNFDLDMVQLNEFVFEGDALYVERQLIRRLKVEVAQPTGFAMLRSGGLRRFPKREEVDILSEEPCSEWYSLLRVDIFRSLLENVTLIEKGTGMMVDVDAWERNG